MVTGMTAASRSPLELSKHPFAPLLPIYSWLVQKRRRSCKLTIYESRVQKEDAVAILYDTAALSDLFICGPSTVPALVHIQS